MNTSKLKFFKKINNVSQQLNYSGNIYSQSYLVLQAQKTKTYYEAWINYREVRRCGVKTKGTWEHIETES